MNKLLKTAELIFAGILGVLIIAGLVVCFTGRGANKVPEEKKRLVADLGTLSVADVSAEKASKTGEKDENEQTPDETENGDEKPQIGTQEDEPKPESKEALLNALREELRAQMDQGAVPEFSAAEQAEIRSAFSDTVFFGDSVAQAIGTYGMVDPSSVIYKRGGTLDTLYPLTEQVKQVYPGKVVIFTGLNDCNHYMENLAGYEADYIKILDSLSETVGAENIAVLSLLPPSNALGATRDDLRQAPVFDGKLREICGAKGVTYIDIQWMVNQAYYLEDGIHFNAAFYRTLFRYLKTAMFTK